MPDLTHATPPPEPPRTVAVRLEGGGQLVIPEPSWCEGHPDVVMHPSDVAHASPEIPVMVTTSRGEVPLLYAALDHAPFSVLGGRELHATVYIAGQYWRFDVAGLYALADEIAERAPAVLREVADQLAAALEEAGES